MLTQQRRRPRRDFTEEEIKQLKVFSTIRLPIAQMCLQLDVDETTFYDMLKRNGAARRAVELGESGGETQIRRTLFERAVGRPAQKVIDKDGTERWLPAIEPDQKALEFFCRTQLRWTTVDVHEHTGPNGGPLFPANASLEVLEAERDKALAELDKLRARIKK